jgi:Ca2+-binding EF-hand superfamily protein
MSSRTPPVYSIPPGCDDATLGEIFEYLDFDKDGYIGKEELRVGLALMGTPVREDVLDVMVALGDQDGDGLITREDFFTLHQNPRSAFERILENVPTVPGHRVRKMREFDPPDIHSVIPADGSYNVRHKTIEIVHALLGVEEIKAKDIKVMYKRFMELDAKKSGRLNLLQFTKIFDQFTSIENRKLKTNYINTLFNFCDSDNSNYVDSKEFITTLCWLGNFSNIDKLRFSFMLFDINGDGVMDRNEVTQLLSSISLGDLDRSVLAERVDEIFKKISNNNAKWMEYTLTFEELVQVADENPDLFDVMGEQREKEGEGEGGEEGEGEEDPRKEEALPFVPPVIETDELD